MTKEEILAKVRSIIAEQLGVELAEVTDQASFTDDLGADSLKIVELIMAIEEGMEIDIPLEDAEQIITVQDISLYIEEHGG